MEIAMPVPSTFTYGPVGSSREMGSVPTIMVWLTGASVVLIFSFSVPLTETPGISTLTVPLNVPAIP